jgi:FlaA1/EpsC-like NDP-sugar epimerase
MQYKQPVTKAHVKRTAYFFLIIALLVMGFPLYVYLTNNYNTLAQQPSICPIKSTTGLFCLGCGITKSMVSCYHGNWQHAFQHHILGLFLLAAACIVFVLAIYQLITQKQLFKSSPYTMPVFYGILIVLSTYNTIRNAMYISTHTRQEILQQTIWKQPHYLKQK